VSIIRWIAVVVIALLGAGFAAAQDIDPALEEEMRSLEAVTQRLRGLDALEEIDRAFPTRQETIDYLRDLYERELPVDEAQRYETFYVALDLLSAETDLRDVYLELLGSQVAGFYDPDTRTMNVIPMTSDDPGNSLSLTEAMIYVHEYTHALQDQHFGLDALTESDEVADMPDRLLAVTALIEGDATAIMTVYSQEIALRNPMAAFSLLLEGVQAGNLFLPSGIPDILVRELLFPYEQGLNFVVALYEAGEWDAIDAAYADPPATSEQIIHPDKYLAGEGAQPVDLPDFASALGAGWESTWDTTLGEFYLNEHLRTQLGSVPSQRGASGWGGDRFRVYSNGDQLAWALRIVWDTAQDKDEFLDVYADFGADRFDTEVQDGCWSDDSGALCLLDEGASTLVVSAPSLEMALAVEEAVSS
jgi:hypothetical protein